MLETISVFDNLENDETNRRVAARRALALAHVRVEGTLGAFLRGAQNESEFEARLALVQEDMTHHIANASEEVGYDKPEFITASLLDHYRLAAKHCSCCNGEDCSCCGGGCDGDCSCGSKKSAVEFKETPEEDEEDEEKTASRTADDKHWIQDAVKKPGELHKDLGVPEGEKIPEDKLESAEHSDSKKVRERAQFAENMKGLHHGGMKQSAPLPQGLGLPGTPGSDNSDLLNQEGSDPGFNQGFPGTAEAPNIPATPQTPFAAPAGGGPTLPGQNPAMPGGGYNSPYAVGQDVPPTSPMPPATPSASPQAGGNANLPPQGANQVQGDQGGFSEMPYNPGQNNPQFSQANPAPGAANMNLNDGVVHLPNKGSNWTITATEFNPSDQNDDATRKVACPVCGGKGKSASSAPCSHCGGTGKVHNFGGSALEALDKSYAKTAWTVTAVGEAGMYADVSQGDLVQEAQALVQELSQIDQSQLDPQQLQQFQRILQESQALIGQVHQNLQPGGPGQMQPQGNRVSPGPPKSQLNMFKEPEGDPNAPLNMFRGAAGNTDLGGPEPKIDKDKQTDSNPKKEEESAVEDSGRWPTKRKDITEPIKAENREVGGHPNHELVEIGEKTTESESLPSNKGDAGWTDGGVNKGPHTKTFPNDGQVDPVTKETQ